jgi:hypothetical protein
MTDTQILENIPFLEDGDKIEIIFGKFNGVVGNCKLNDDTINKIKNLIKNKTVKSYTITCKKYYYKNLLLVCSNNNKQYFKKIPKYCKIGKNLAININNIQTIDQHSFPIFDKYSCIKEEKNNNYVYNDPNGKIIISFVEENNNSNKINYVKISIFDLNKISNENRDLIISILKEIS